MEDYDNLGVWLITISGIPTLLPPSSVEVDTPQLDFSFLYIGQFCPPHPQFDFFLLLLNLFLSSGRVM